MGLNSNDVFPSKYLRAGDLRGRGAKVIIKSVKIEEVGQKREPRPVAYFENKEKGVVINKTNWNSIAHVYGDDTDGWLGHTIELYPSETTFNGDIVECIRIRVPSVPPKAPPAPVRIDHIDDGLDDEIPF